jgi:hypothetical protein
MKHKTLLAITLLLGFIGLIPQGIFTLLSIASIWLFRAPVVYLASVVGKFTDYGEDINTPKEQIEGWVNMTQIALANLKAGI